MIVHWLGFNYLCDLTHKWLPKLFIHVRAFVCVCVSNVSPKDANTMSHLSLTQAVVSRKRVSYLRYRMFVVRS